MTARTTTLRTVTVLVAAAIAGLPLAGVASAAPAADRDCPDFSSQAAAQAALVPGDPERLDRDNDGLACEDSEYGSGTPATSSPTSGDDQVTAVPSGSVDAGDGSATGGAGADAAAPLVLAGFGAVAASGAAVTVWRSRRPARDRG